MTVFSLNAGAEVTCFPQPLNVKIAQFSASKYPDLDFAAETHRAYKL